MNIIYIGKTLTPIQSYPYHAHRFWEILLCLDGKGICVIDQTEYPFENGTIFLIPPHTPHRKISEQGYTDASLMIQDFTEETKSLIVTSDDGSQTASRLFDLIHEAFYRSQNDRLFADLMACALYQFILGREISSRQQNAAVERFEALLSDHLSDTDFDLSDALNHTGYSRNHFRSLFAQETGETPVTYLQRLRVNYAKQLLSSYDGKCFIQDVALRSGFSDPYYFSRIFRKREGISPREYLKIHGNQRSMEFTKLLKDNQISENIREIHQFAASHGMEEIIDTKTSKDQ